MKVIKEGKKIEDTMHVTCRTCEAELEIESKDLTIQTEEDWRDTYNYYTFICPCCQRQNSLMYRDLSDGIRFEIDKRR